MLNDHKLQWVQRARTGKVTTAVVGPVAQEVVRALGRGGPAWRQKLIDLLWNETGPDLLDHAEPTSLSRGVLTFQVGQAALGYQLRLDWEQRLLNLIAARLPQAGVHTIRFVTRKLLT